MKRKAPSRFARAVEAELERIRAGNPTPQRKETYMPMTRDQALAFVEAAVKSPKMKAHLDCALGWNRVAETKDYDSRDAESQDRAEETALYFGEVAKVLEGTIANLRQAEIPGTEKKKARAS